MKSEQAQMRIPRFYAPFTALIGRAQEEQFLQTLLVRPQVRMVTLSGIGGGGKTHLALHVAAAVQQKFADGVCFISLAELDDPAQVPGILASALALAKSASIEDIKHALHEKHLLLLLDNVEHLPGVKPLLLDILACCPGLTLLLTSWVGMHVPGEYELWVRPLALPDAAQINDAQELLGVPSVAFFLQCMQASKLSLEVSNDDIQAIAQICTQLAGLPLALELASAHCIHLSPQTVLECLKHPFAVLTGGRIDLPARQQTLYTTFLWGFNLLSAPAQRLFKLIATFPEGCTRPTLRDRWIGAGEATGGLEPLIRTLMNLHFVQEDQPDDGEPLLTMLPLLQSFGRELHTTELKQTQVADFFSQEVQTPLPVQQSQEGLAGLQVPLPSTKKLTRREYEILLLVSKGLSNVMIARQLLIRPRTVNAHIQAIYRKLGISTRSAATRYALEHDMGE